MEIIFEIDKDKLTDYLNILANNHLVLVNELEKSDKLFEYYIWVKETVNKLYNTEKYSIVVDIINKLYRPSILYPGTIGAFIWGCFSNYYGNVNQNCSSLCLNGIPSHFNEEIKKCQYQIWRYFQGKLRRETETNNNRAYIYVDSNWNGFTKDEILLLQNNDVIFVTILTTENSKHYIKIPMSSLINIPIIEKINTKEMIKLSKNKNIHVYLLLSLLVLCILGYIYKIYMNKNKTENKNKNY